MVMKKKGAVRKVVKSKPAKAGFGYLGSVSAPRVVHGVAALQGVRDKIQSLKVKLAQGSKSDMDSIGAHLDELLLHVNAAIGAAK